MISFVLFSSYYRIHIGDILLSLKKSFPVEKLGGQQTGHPIFLLNVLGMMSSATQLL